MPGAMDIATLSPDAPATLLLSSRASFERDVLDLRRDFERLDEALAYLASYVAVGRRHTAWLITQERLIPPEQVLRLRDKLEPAPSRERAKAAEAA